ncbi:MAG: 4Fe-4S binding protein [Meiothermus sp.]|uniref:4Fe-4S dicluster domain-containing protein n=1 Tax=Meiothermus sp. TaxID=1955249 RepID=UPI0025EE6804|nr:4Fe-4S dicluster domain-containing protein [Meiothermus sp.]MCS7194171.1 4Fe-4S binding protein [Meiothermus sp.]MCX7740635.1 4Fe-4S binding protein [Meiothermus sp.]MDW8090032.1 4Fe-4S binding protein [Meiothermus sp.]
MGLLDNLVGAFLKLTDPTPDYTGPRCLLERNSVGGCDRCQQACPHQAIRLENFTVEIDEVRCTSCGLCTSACPGLALEFPLGSIQEKLHRGKGQLRCSRAPGAGDEVYCLGQLTPGLLAEASARFGPLTLAHGDCASCKIGGPSIPERVLQIAEEGRRYFPGLEVRLQQEPLAGAEVGRREFFGALFGGAKRSAAELMPSLPLLPEEPYEDKRAERPAELRLRRAAAIRAQSVRWPRIAVGEGCTLCPVCSNVCPTKAVERERSPSGEEYVLKLDVSACTGCGACVESCPPQVITLAEADRAEVLGGPIELYRGVPPWYDL